jgi:hypothetical protein
MNVSRTSYTSCPRQNEYRYIGTITCCTYKTLRYQIIPFLGWNLDVFTVNPIEINTIHQSASGASSSSSSPTIRTSRVLLPEIQRHIMSYLIIEPVIASEITCTGCSLHDCSHDLSCCINDDDTSWWMSAQQSMPQGKGRQYVQF